MSLQSVRKESTQTAGRVSGKNATCAKHAGVGSGSGYIFRKEGVRVAKRAVFPQTVEKLWKR